MNKALKEAFISCLNSNINCPYLVHYRPKRITQKQRSSKLHPFCVTDDYLTKQFAYYRDKSKTYQHIPTANRPKFHSLRGFGAQLYEQQGFDKSYIQLLTGHASEKMLDVYLAEHEANKPIKIDFGFISKTQPP